jgi:hypothetical protein
MTSTPAVPTGLSALPIPNTEIYLNWDTPYSSSQKTLAITGWKVYRSTTSGSGFSLRATTTTSEYTDTGAEGVTYYYKVAAVGAHTDSSLTSEVSATIQGDYTAPDWTIPDVAGVDQVLPSVAKGAWSIPLSGYYAANDGTPAFTIQSISALGGSSTADISINPSTGALSGTDLTPSDTYTVSVDLAEASAAGDWASRSTAPGVVWAHDFSESAAELELFTRLDSNSPVYPTQSNPDPATLINPLTRVSSGLGSSLALRSRAVGAVITADIPQVAKGATGVVISVNDASRFPDPALFGGSYPVFIGCSDSAGQNTNPDVFEKLTITGRNLGNNTLTVTRTSESNTIRVSGVDYAAVSPYAPAIPASTGLYRVGYTNSGSWNRPLCAFPAGQNGKATPDVGIANGSARKARTWPTTRNSYAHRNFREGYWGAPWYWDTTVNPSAPYKDFTPPYTGDGQSFVRPDAWERDEFYLQFRVRVSDARLRADGAKLFYIQSAAVSGAGQLFMSVGPQYFSFIPTPSERVAGTVIGDVARTLAGGGDARQPQGGKLGGSTQSDSWDFPGTATWQTDYQTAYYENRSGATPYAFCYQGDQWVTFLIRMKVGRCNAEQFQPDGVGSANPAIFPLPSGASYLTQLEIKVHMQGWADYKTLVNIPDARWFFSDSLGDAGSVVYNAPGLNTFWMTQEFNMYVGSGSLCPPDSASAYADFTQAILSRNPIPVPV